MNMKDLEQLEKAQRDTEMMIANRTRCLVNYIQKFCPYVLENEPGIKSFVGELNMLFAKKATLDDDIMSALLGEADSASFKEAPNGQPRT